MIKIKAIIFDMDGVIIDSEPIHERLDYILFDELGISVPKEFFYNYIGVSNEKLWSDVIEKYNLDKTLDDLLQRCLELKIANLEKEQIDPIDGIVDLLKLSKENNLLIAVASSSPEKYIHKVLEKFNIKDYFHVVVSGEHVTNSKPAPDIFNLATSKLNVDSTDCLVIEDSTHGVLASKNADIKCIGFNNINSKNQDLSKADLIVDSINEIVEKFSSL